MAGSLVKTIYNENDEFSYRAEVFNDGNMHIIRYYGPNNSYLREEYSNNSNLNIVEQTAKNYLNSIKVLNG